MKNTDYIDNKEIEMLDNKLFTSWMFGIPECHQQIFWIE